MSRGEAEKVRTAEGWKVRALTHLASFIALSTFAFLYGQRTQGPEGLENGLFGHVAAGREESKKKIRFFLFSPLTGFE